MCDKVVFLFCLQKSRHGRDGHGGLEEHDLIAPAPHRRGLPRARHATTADPANRSAAETSQTGVVTLDIITSFSPVASDYRFHVATRDQILQTHNVD